MTTAGMVRVMLTDPGTNVVHLSVACPTHARTIVERSGRNHRFQLSPISATDRRCDVCVAGGLRAGPLDFGPLDDGPDRVGFVCAASLACRRPPVSRRRPNMTLELDYRCYRPVNAYTGTAGMSTAQCRGRMVAGFDVVSGVPVVTCDVCGRVALAEVVA